MGARPRVLLLLASLSHNPVPPVASKKFDDRPSRAACVIHSLSQPPRPDVTHAPCPTPGRRKYMAVSLSSLVHIHDQLGRNICSRGSGVISLRLFQFLNLGY